MWRVGFLATVRQLVIIFDSQHLSQGLVPRRDSVHIC